MRRLSLVVCIVALACGDPTSNLPTSPSAPTVVSVTLTGPDSIAPGQSVQLNAAIRLSDGTVKSPSTTTPMQWFSSNDVILRVSSTGVATAGQQLGDVRVTVIHGLGATQRQAIKEFVVVPSGTYRLAGTVTEAEFPTVAVSAARVSVSPGSLSTVTDFSGGYALYGVPADAVITVTKSGYAELSQAIRLASHATQNFRLVITGQRVMLAGNYTLTIDISGSCSSAFPLSPALQRRTYDAVMAQNGSELAVTLTENRFKTNSFGYGNRFTGRAGTAGASFYLGPFDLYYYYYPNVAERLPDGTVLVPSGEAITTGSAAGLSGTLNGSIYRWDATFPSLNSAGLGYCNSATTQFTLTPR